MGVYSTFGESGVMTDELLNIDPFSNDIEESAYDVSVAGAYELMAENEHNYNQLMKAVGIFELKSLEENGEVVYEAVDIKGFIGRIKAFFIKIIQKIAAIVKKYFSLIDGLIKNDKDFVKKYQPALIKLSDQQLKDISVDLYTYTHLDWNADTAGKVGLGAVASEIGGGIDTSLLTDPSKVLTSSPDKKNDYEKAFGDATNEDILDKVRTKILVGGKTTGDISSSDFASEIHDYFRNNESSRDSTDLTPAIIKTALNDILATKGLKDPAARNFKNFKEWVDKLCKNLDKASNTLASEKNVPDGDGPAYGSHASLLNKLATLNRSVLNQTQTVFNGQMAALKEKNAQARHICTAALTRAKNEGFEHFTNTGSTGSFFDEVVIR